MILNHLIVSPINEESHSTAFMGNLISFYCRGSGFIGFHSV